LLSGWGFAPDPTGELIALPKLLAGKGEGKGGEGDRKAREGKRGDVASS